MKINTVASMILAGVLTLAAGLVPASAASFTMTMVSPPTIIPSPSSTTDFSFDITVTNTGAQTEELYGTDFTLSFSPNLPASQFQWLGITSNVPPSNNRSIAANSAPASFPVFVMTNARAVIANATSVSPGNGTSIAPGQTKTIATLQWRLAQNAFRGLYNVSISQMHVSYYNGGSTSSSTPATVSGFIATPEPTGGLAFLLVSAASLMRRGRKNRRIARSVVA